LMSATTPTIVLAGIRAIPTPTCLPMGSSPGQYFFAIALLIMVTGVEVRVSPSPNHVVAPAPVS